MFSQIEELADRMRDDVPDYDYLMIPSGGVHVAEVIQEALDMSQATGSSILLIFNGVPLMILPGSDPDILLAQYEDAHSHFS